jgi:hypothetical protein
MRWFDLRLAFRLHRFEFVVFGLLIAVIGVAALVVAGNLDATGYGVTCLALGPDSPMPPSCEVAGNAFYDIQNKQASLVQSLLIVLPFLLAVLVGVPLVARELERGTSRLAWSLAPSRTHWFLTRLVPALVGVFLLSLVAGLALDRLMGATEPTADPFRSFAGFGGRGIVLATRTTFFFAVAVAIGALFGRVLPALIIAAVIGAVGLSGGSYVHSRILATEAVIVADVEGNARPGDLFVDQRIRTPDGTIVTWEDLNVLVPPPEDGMTEWPPPDYTFVALVIPAERYPEVQLREIVALAAGTLVALLIAGTVVRRRRPG